MHEDLIAALRAHHQADEDGVMCIVSREACVMAADALEAMQAALKPFADTDLTSPLMRDTFGFDVLRARAALQVSGAADPVKPENIGALGMPVNVPVTASAAPSLTDADIDNAIERHCGSYDLNDDEYRSMFDFARAIERAHGIGEQE